MINSTTWIKKIKIHNVAAIVFWLCVWQGISMYIGEAILLVSPFVVLKTLVLLMGTTSFWVTVVLSSTRIIGGFLLAVVCGMILASLSAGIPMVKVLLSPLMVTIKSIPVASFIILALLWLNSSQLAIFISFLMVLPIMYTNILSGILSIDKKLVEMTDVFRLSTRKRIQYFYLPAVRPFFMAACTMGLGMCWKSGVAAEVIGITDGSIGGALYNAKIFLATGEVFAWTAVIVVVSVVFEKIFLKGLARMLKVLETVKLEGERKLVENPHPTDIILHKVGKSYGKQEVLADLRLQIEGAEKLCIMGPSGKGKTTLIGIIMGRIKVDQGEVLVTLQLRFACQFQEDRLAEGLSATANIGLICPHLKEDEIQLAFGQIGLTKEDLVKKVRDLSGGQKRRVALVRAVLSPSDVLVLDEPFKGLDEKMRKEAAHFVVENLGGRTLLVITHEKEDAQILGAKIVEL